MGLTRGKNIMTTTSHMQRVLDNAHCLIDQETIEKAFDHMAEQISQHPLSQEAPIFLGVAVGGLLPLAKLTLRLNFPLEIDFVHVSSYQDKTYASALSWKTHPHLALKDRTIVIVDDILDKGMTLSALIEFCKKAGAKAVYTAVLLNKVVERAKGGLAAADFVGLEIEDKFVFGYGLDYKSFWRNAPGIYEPAEEDRR